MNPQMLFYFSQAVTYHVVGAMNIPEPKKEGFYLKKHVKTEC